jgi:hypothetical protein
VTQSRETATTGLLNDAGWWERQQKETLVRAVKAEQRVVELEMALRRLISAEDAFVEDTGLKWSDLITDAVAAARRLL